MPETTRTILKEHLDKLTVHLQQENPDLVDAVRSFRSLDSIAHKLGLLERHESYAAQVTWWPLIAVLGTFSSGKSTFINRLLGQRLQSTGNQAVDDKFTVICYGRDATPHVLPALALDSDPRFPFYNISREIDEVTHGEGDRLDSYLQLKTCNSEQVRGKIIIDSPGFDADAQRTETLRITNYIIDLSDLVLVFFDARHPEPGAMRDTLDYLVEGTLKRPDFNKFMHILNQIDNAAREDNPEEVFAAWQRALAQKGLTAGRFYRIYDPDAAMPIPDEGMRRRFESKRDADVNEITSRIQRLEVDRSYRVAGMLEQTAATIRDTLVPRIREANRVWKRRVLRTDAVLLVVALALLLGISIALGWWQGLSFTPPWLAFAQSSPAVFWGVAAAVVVVAGFLLHRWARRWGARKIVAQIERDPTLGEHAPRVANAFMRNVRSWRPIFIERPVGWGGGSRRKLDRILAEADRVIQRLNDKYTNPSGDADQRALQASAATPPPPEPPRPAEPGQPAEPARAAGTAPPADATRPPGATHTAETAHALDTADPGDSAHGAETDRRTGPAVESSEAAAAK
ncbi:MAG: dynamin family protein [Gammaproteobacteria bacterium]|nr:dynamin family protein [Gammaproteobacteria bacterium]